MKTEYIFEGLERRELFSKITVFSRNKYVRYIKIDFFIWLKKHDIWKNM